MEKSERLARARNLNKADESTTSDTTLDDLYKRLTALEIKTDFAEESEWSKQSPIESPWDDVCVRHGSMSEGAGAKDCPYPKETHAAIRWNAGYAFSAYWRSLIADELKDQIWEMQGIKYD